MFGFQQIDSYIFYSNDDEIMIKQLYDMDFKLIFYDTPQFRLKSMFEYITDYHYQIYPETLENPNYVHFINKLTEDRIAQNNKVLFFGNLFKDFEFKKMGKSFVNTNFLVKSKICS